MLPACGPGAPAPAPAEAPKTQAAPPATPAAPAAPAAPSTAAAPNTPPREPPLTQAEIDLINSDPATLTPEKRRERAFALRRKIMQNPDSPAARQLESIRRAVEAGEMSPTLPSSTPQLSAAAPPAPPADAPVAEKRP